MGGMYLDGDACMGLWQAWGGEGVCVHRCVRERGRGDGARYVYIYFIYELMCIYIERRPRADSAAEDISALV